LQSERYQIVKYSPEYRAQLLALQAYLWGGDPDQRAAYLEWKYDHNPFGGDVNIYVAFCDEQLVGMVGAYGVVWEAGEPARSFSGLCFADLIILPEYRTQNLFPRLMSFALDDLSGTDYDYVFDLSAASHVVLTLLMQGWRRISLQTAQRQTKQTPQFGLLDNAKTKSRIMSLYQHLGGASHTLPLLTSTYHRLGRHVRGLFLRCSTESSSAFAKFDDNAGRHKANPKVSFSRTSRPRAMAELARRLRTDGRIRHVRDEQYFNWRFQNPLSDYRFLFWENGRFDGYLVLRTRKGKLGDDTRACIVDWEAANEQVWADLLQTAIQWSNFKELYTWSASLSDKAKTLLREAGFVFRDRTGCACNEVPVENILVRSLGRRIRQSETLFSEKALLDLANWDLRMVYSDLY